MADAHGRVPEDDRDARAEQRSQPIARVGNAVLAGLQEEMSEFSQISTQVTDSIDDAVRALQFEDMATQLIDCVQRRIARLDAVVIRLETIALHFEQAPRRETHENHGPLTELRTQLESLKNECATILLSPVAMQGLAAGGGIDLF